MDSGAAARTISTDNIRKTSGCAALEIHTIVFPCMKQGLVLVFQGLELTGIIDRSAFLNCIRCVKPIFFRGICRSPGSRNKP